MCVIGPDVVASLSRVEPPKPSTSLGITLAALERISWAGCGFGVDTRDCRGIALDAIREVKELEQRR